MVPCYKSRKDRPDNTQHSQETDIHAPDGIPYNSPAAYLRLWRLGHWDRQLLLIRLRASGTCLLIEVKISEEKQWMISDVLFNYYLCFRLQGLRYTTTNMNQTRTESHIALHRLKYFTLTETLNLRKQTRNKNVSDLWTRGVPIKCRLGQSVACLRYDLKVLSLSLKKYRDATSEGTSRTLPLMLFPNRCVLIMFPFDVMVYS